MLLEGSVDDWVAADIGVHLDACAQCTSRLDALDPMVALLAQVPEPETPDLLAAVLAEVQRAPVAVPERMPAAQLVTGGLMLATAALLMVVFGDPVSAITRISFAIGALGTIAGKLSIAGPVAVVIASGSALTMTALSVATSRIVGPVALERRTQ